MANPLYDTLFGRHAGKPTPFLHLPEGTILTHEAFLQMGAQFAHCMTALGLRPGDCLAAQVDKSPEALAVYAACAQTGVIFLPLNTGYTATELDYFIGNSGAKLVLASSRAEAALAPVTESYGATLKTLNPDGSGSFLNLTKDHPDEFPTAAREPDDLAALLYTSGTTGLSKGAMLTQANLLSNARTLAVYWRFSDADVLLNALPIFHTHGLFVASNVTLVAGGSMIFLPKFDIDEMVAWMSRATTMMGVPTFYTRLLDDDRFDAKLVAHMRLFVSGSAPLLAETHVRFEKRTRHRILERYGMTETNMNTSNPYEGERRPGTVGLPLPGVEVRITSTGTAEPLNRGEVGQIEVRGPNVFKGYWNMPEKTAAELRENGFFLTGDLGMIDESGYLHIVGRDKDMIISGGYNIYPREIELILDEQPGVLESAVIGVPHADLGESVLGILVPKPGESLDLEAIAQSAAARLARFKLPRRLVCADCLPRNAMGKIQKNALRSTYK